jgi:hypothetical protein
MGKKAKEHRRKVEARNARIKQQKSGMQKAFDMLLKQEIERLKQEDVKVEAGGQEVNFEVVEEKVIEHAFKFTPNEEESAKINKEFEEVTETEG